MRWSRRCGPSPRSWRMSSHATGSTCRPLGVARPRRRPRRFAGTEPAEPAPDEDPGPGPEGRSPAIRNAARMAPRGRAAGGGLGGPSSCGAGPKTPSCFLRGGGCEAADGACAPPSTKTVSGTFRGPRSDGGKPTAPLTSMQRSGRDRGPVARASRRSRDGMVIESGGAASEPRRPPKPTGEPGGRSHVHVPLRPRHRRDVHRLRARRRRRAGGKREGALDPG